MARQMKKDKAKYFGPYTSVGAVRDTIELIRKLYKIRSCNRRLPRDIGLERPCLNYHIHQCGAPCQGYVDQQEYRESIDQVLQFLNGNYDLILGDLQRKMEKASEAMEYERAIEYRVSCRVYRKSRRSRRLRIRSGMTEILWQWRRIWRMQSCRYSLCVMAD